MIQGQTRRERRLREVKSERRWGEKKSERRDGEMSREESERRDKETKQLRDRRSTLLQEIQILATASSL